MAPGVSTTSSPPSRPLQTLHLLGFLARLVHPFSSRAISPLFSNLGIAIAYLIPILRFLFSPSLLLLSSIVSICYICLE